MAKNSNLINQLKAVQAFEKKVINVGDEEVLEMSSLGKEGKVPPPVQTKKEVEEEEESIEDNPDKSKYFFPTLTVKQLSAKKTAVMTDITHERLKAAADAHNCSMTDLLNNIIEIWWNDQKEWLIPEIQAAAKKKVKAIS